MSFTAFSPDLVGFLEELAENNDRDWFKANQPRYEATVREPVRAFVRSMAPILADHAPQLRADDRKVGGSMMRPQRDTRFSKDKTPYKTNVGIQFRHAAGKDVHAPGLYLHVHPTELFVGLGMYRPASPDLRAIRARIDQEPAEFLAIVEAPGFQEQWTIGHGEPLKRNPRGFDKDHPMGEWLRMKSHILSQEIDRETLLSPELPQRLAELLESGRRYCTFLCAAIGQPW